MTTSHIKLPGFCESAECYLVKVSVMLPVAAADEVSV